MPIAKGVLSRKFSQKRQTILVVITALKLKSHFEMHHMTNKILDPSLDWLRISLAESSSRCTKNTKSFQQMNVKVGLDETNPLLLNQNLISKYAQSQTRSYKRYRTAFMPNFIALWFHIVVNLLNSKILGRSRALSHGLIRTSFENITLLGQHGHELRDHPLRVFVRRTCARYDDDHSLYYCSFPLSQFSLAFDKRYHITKHQRLSTVRTPRFPFGVEEEEDGYSSLQTGAMQHRPRVLPHASSESTLRWRMEELETLESTECPECPGPPPEFRLPPPPRPPFLTDGTFCSEEPLTEIEDCVAIPGASLSKTLMRRKSAIGGFGSHDRCVLPHEPIAAEHCPDHHLRGGTPPDGSNRVRRFLERKKESLVEPKRKNNGRIVATAHLVKGIHPTVLEATLTPSVKGAYTVSTCLSFGNAQCAWLCQVGATRGTTSTTSHGGTGSAGGAVLYEDLPEAVTHSQLHHRQNHLPSHHPSQAPTIEVRNPGQRHGLRERQPQQLQRARAPAPHHLDYLDYRDPRAILRVQDKPSRAVLGGYRTPRALLAKSQGVPLSIATHTPCTPRCTSATSPLLQNGGGGSLLRNSHLLLASQNALITSQQPLVQLPTVPPTTTAVPSISTCRPDLEAANLANENYLADGGCVASGRPIDSRLPITPTHRPRLLVQDVPPRSQSLANPSGQTRPPSLVPRDEISNGRRSSVDSEGYSYIDFKDRELESTRYERSETIAGGTVASKLYGTTSARSNSVDSDGYSYIVDSASRRAPGTARRIVADGTEEEVCPLCTMQQIHSLLSKPEDVYLNVQTT
ncbi:hypothetical protein WN51_03625 [Melipona quadrifasciata]|uniref:Uncharacterized protein n=1 Tax=Melipona quadrifasciata TaxID=166423 RepID=A0A0N0BDX6_9HYME|nr:hypothetical protein WN51_03625 [Melipona quadrifasciata]